MSDISKSIKEIFEERISSPFYGSLIVSWLLWNWEIPYVTFFVDPTKINGNKLDYIVSNCNNIWFLIIGPLISTAIIIFAMPLITNYAHKITLLYDEKRRIQKNEILHKRLLTQEESLELILENERIYQNYSEIIQKKEVEIGTLKKQLEQSLTLKPEISDSKLKSYEDEFESLMKSRFFKTIKDVGDRFRTGYTDMDPFQIQMIDFFVANDLIDSVGGSYKFTEKGKFLYNKYLKMLVAQQNS
jgi:hypothetical protein